MNLVLTPAAEGVIENHIRYLLDEFAYDAAERFPRAVEDALQFILENPHAGAPRFARGRSPVFRILRMYYIPPTGADLYVVRVLHSARDIGTIIDEE